jgi:hypothetical protein
MVPAGERDHELIGPSRPPRSLPGVDEQPREISRVGTARALVSLAAVLAVGGSVLVCVAALVVGPALAERPGLPGALIGATAVFAAVVVVFAIAAGVFAARARTVRSAVVGGCGTLLAGIVIGLAALLLLISRFA